MSIWLLNSGSKRQEHKQCKSAEGWKSLKSLQNSTYSSLAQSVERMTVNHDVACSSQARGAIKSLENTGFSRLFNVLHKCPWRILWRMILKVLKKFEKIKPWGSQIGLNFWRIFFDFCVRKNTEKPCVYAGFRAFQNTQNASKIIRINDTTNRCIFNSLFLLTVGYIRAFKHINVLFYLARSSICL